MIFNLTDNVRRSAGLELAYTGAMTQSSISVSGALYTLYTLTTSGTLTVKGKGTADVWMCGGGANGSAFGGGGGYFTQALQQELSRGAYVVSIGAAQGTTSITQGDTYNVSASGATNQNGASGGGGYTSVYSGPGGYSTPQTPGYGGGVSTRPFGDSANFTSLPCAGGGGAGTADSYSDYQGQWSANAGDGGAGGSNGGSGGTSSAKYSTTDNAGGAGGATGGGAGGGTGGYASAATYYGSGGGGHENSQRRGAGYQGVVFIRIPIETTPRPNSSGYKYYRLNITGMMRDSAASQYLSVAELALYNGSAAVSYTGATFTASSQQGSNPAANAFDGSASTMWHVNDTPESAWIQVQLASASKITSFAITMRSDVNDRLNAFTLDGSNDGSTWTTLYTGTNTASDWAQGATKTFTI